jgi:lysophospholipase L1-like esterase
MDSGQAGADHFAIRDASHMKRSSAFRIGCWLLISLSGCSKSTATDDSARRNDAGGNAGSGGDAPAGDTKIRTVQADDAEHLLYSGRIDFTDPKAPTFSAPGVLVSAKFTGVSVSVLLGDEFRGVNYANVTVDGEQHKIRPERSKDEYPVVSDLPYGEHTVEFSKRTEASQGPMTFKGFKFGGTPMPAPERPKRRIEIIGDSISCGSGAEGLTYEQCDDAIAYENATVTYGAVLARNLDAEYHITAVSGIGTIRNYNCSDPNTMPKVYDRLFLEQADSPVWDTSQFVPDAIIVALGTNDFSPDNCRQPPLSVECDPENYDSFISTLGEFVGNTLRGYYPKAHIFLTSSPLLGDGWPEPYPMDNAGAGGAGAGGAGAGGTRAGGTRAGGAGTDNGATSTCPYTSRTSHIAALSKVVSDLSQAGDSRVHWVDTVPKVAAGGCTGHPSAKEHSNIGGTCASNQAGCEDWLLNPIKEVMGW